MAAPQELELKNTHFIAKVDFYSNRSDLSRHLYITLTSLTRFWTIRLERNGYGYAAYHMGSTNVHKIFPRRYLRNSVHAKTDVNRFISDNNQPEQYKTWFDWGLSDENIWKAFNGDDSLGRIQLDEFGFVLVQQQCRNCPKVVRRWPPDTDLDFYNHINMQIANSGSYAATVDPAAVQCAVSNLAEHGVWPLRRQLAEHETRLNELAKQAAQPNLEPAVQELQEQVGQLIRLSHEPAAPQLQCVVQRQQEMIERLQEQVGQLAMSRGGEPAPAACPMMPPLAPSLLDKDLLLDLLVDCLAFKPENRSKIIRAIEQVARL